MFSICLKIESFIYETPIRNLLPMSKDINCPDKITINGHKIKQDSTKSKNIKSVII